MRGRVRVRASVSACVRASRCVREHFCVCTGARACVLCVLCVGACLRACVHVEGALLCQVGEEELGVLRDPRLHTNAQHAT